MDNLKLFSKEVVHTEILKIYNLFEITGPRKACFTMNNIAWLEAHKLTNKLMF